MSDKDKKLPNTDTNASTDAGASVGEDKYEFTPFNLKTTSSASQPLALEFAGYEIESKEGAFLSGKTNINFNEINHEVSASQKVGIFTFGGGNTKSLSYDKDIGLVSGRERKNFVQVGTDDYHAKFSGGKKHESGPDGYTAETKSVGASVKIGGLEAEHEKSTKEAHVNTSDGKKEETTETDKTKVGVEMGAGVKLTHSVENEKKESLTEKPNSYTETHSDKQSHKTRLEVNSKESNGFAVLAAAQFNMTMAVGEKVFEEGTKSERSVTHTKSQPTQPDNTKANEKAEEAKKDAEAESKKQTEEMEQEAAKETEEVKEEEAKQTEEAQAEETKQIEEAKQTEEYDYGYGY